LKYFGILCDLSGYYFEDFLQGQLPRVSGIVGSGVQSELDYNARHERCFGGRRQREEEATTIRQFRRHAEETTLAYL